MESLDSQIGALKRGEVGRTVARRIASFKRFRNAPVEAVFSELCFCILTANYNAERAIRIQESIGDGFIGLGERRLATRLRRLGYRFPNTRARYIVEARKHLPNLKKALYGGGDEFALRDYLAKNVKGLGYKEASHFLRNIGYSNLAIIDFHIVDLLAAKKLIKRPKSMSKQKYLEIEAVLSDLGEKNGLTQAELDLYLWHMETGKVLK